MKISEISIYSFSLPLKKSINISNHTIVTRAGLIIIIKDENGNSGFGEISPLPGLDLDTLEQCLKELICFKDKYRNMEMNLLNFSLKKPLMGLMPLFNEFNCSTLFGIESAILSLVLKVNNDLVFDPDIKGGENFRVELNGLFFPDTSEKIVNNQIQYLKTNRFKTVKIKIGRIQKAHEIDQILGLWHSFNKEIQLRLDGNRSLSLEEYSEYHHSLNGLDIEYVEEPVRDTDFLRAAEIPWPMALDESLNKYINRRDPALEGLPGIIKTIILKPASVWGLHNIFRVISESNKKDIDCVMSSSYNTGITLSVLALAGCTAKKNTAHGLDTYKYYGKYILKDKLKINRNKLVVEKKFFTSRNILNYDNLQKVN